jgi:hypothetical protein
MYRSGPFSAKTCYIEKADRVRVKVELGFRASLVVDVRMSNLPTKGMEYKSLSNLKSCLVVIIGGHGVMLDAVEEPWDGVHGSRMFVPCQSPPEGVPSRVFDDETHIDLGEYLLLIGQSISFDPDAVKRDYLSRRK